MTAASTRITRHLDAPPQAVFRALTDARMIAQWQVPQGMTSRVHYFEPHEGGDFRISLTYTSPDAKGKTSAHTDTYHGTFLRLEPDRLVEESLEFESDDPAMQGEMRIIYLLTPAGDGTDLTGLHENLPPGVSTKDNETGWRMAFDNLARLLASSHPG